MLEYLSCEILLSTSKVFLDFIHTGSISFGVTYIFCILLISYWHFLCIFQVRCINVIKGNKYHNIDIFNPLLQRVWYCSFKALGDKSFWLYKLFQWSRYKRSIVYLSLEKVNLSKNFKYLKIADGIIGLRYIGTFLGQM